MSLINQMLQELDARRSDGTSTGPFGPQIRAVPERRRFHPAWLVALALAAVLVGVLAWVFTREDERQIAGAQLPLKLDIDLNAVPQQEQNPPLQPSADTAPPASSAVAQPANPPAPAAERREAVLVPPANLPVPLPPDMKADKPAKGANPVKKVAPPPVPELPVVLPTVSTSPVPLAKNHDAPVSINKQVKELTTQQRAENEFRKAILSMQQGKTAEAITGLEQALQLDPQHTGARQSLIGVLLESKRQDDAVREAREGLDANPAQLKIAMILARLQVEKGELGRAIETLERSANHASGAADYHAFLAALLQRDERHKQAAEHYLQALQKSPQNGVWWMGLGISLQADQRLPEAQEAFKRAKASNTLSPDLQAFVDARLSQLQR